MTNTNMPILYQNIMFGLPSDLARDAFLWATERPGEDRYCYRAEAFAREVDSLVSSLNPMLDAAFAVHEGSGTPFANPMQDTKADLLNFMLTRHANWRFGGNVKPTYAEISQ